MDGEYKFPTKEDIKTHNAKKQQAPKKKKEKDANRKRAAEEKAAKEYVEPYYFWLFNYCGRNYRREIDLLLPPIKKGIRELDKKREESAGKIYWEHRFSSMSPQFLKEKDYYTSITSLLSSAGGAGELSPCAILASLYNGKILERGVKSASKCGVEILGIGNAHLSSDGTLQGQVIAQIDLHAPISAILFELSRIKEKKFDAFPRLSDVSDLSKLPENYPDHKKVIKQTTKASFSSKAENKRAVGLWLWDAIDGPRAVFDNLTDAWKAIRGEKVGYILTKGESPETPIRSRHFPSKGLFAQMEAKAQEAKQEYDAEMLGVFFDVAHRDKPEDFFTVPGYKLLERFKIDITDERYLRRLYLRTKCCIDECEVLTLGDDDRKKEQVNPPH